MSTVTVPRLDLTRPADIADAAQRVQQRLGGRTTVPPDAWAFAASLVESVSDADEEWSEQQDPEHRELLLRAALGISRGLADRGAGDARRHLMLGLQRAADVLDRMADGDAVAPTRSSQEIAAWLAGTLEAPQTEVAALVATSPRTYSRWVGGETAPVGEEARRLRTVAALVAQLRHSLTAIGVLRWFDWPNELLGGRAPREALADPEATPTLFRMAARLRSSVGA
jgi:hypothetical protein